jgi:hypothetical protein
MSVLTTILITLKTTLSTEQEDRPIFHFFNIALLYFLSATAVLYVIFFVRFRSFFPLEFCL